MFYKKYTAIPLSPFAVRCSWVLVNVLCACQGNRIIVGMMNENFVYKIVSLRLFFDVLGCEFSHKIIIVANFFKLLLMHWSYIHFQVILATLVEINNYLRIAKKLALNLLK